MPLFQRYGVEDQLSAMYQPVVQLKSGGYLVINPTEALVSIDINSGRSTREHNIEQTAFAPTSRRRTKSPASCACATWPASSSSTSSTWNRTSHVRKVEKAMKDALKNDRARIQVGRISSFGLMEMSRQRLRTGVLEASTKPCPHCDGTGLMRTAASAGLSALRMIEDEAARGRGERILLRAGREAAVYVLNKKRAELAEIEQRYGVSIEIVIDESFEGARMTVESSGGAAGPGPRAEAPPPVVEDEDEDIAEDGGRGRPRRRSHSRKRGRTKTRSGEPQREASARVAAAPAPPRRPRTRPRATRQEGEGRTKPASGRGREPQLAR